MIFKKVPRALEKVLVGTFFPRAVVWPPCTMEYHLKNKWLNIRTHYFIIVLNVVRYVDMRTALITIPLNQSMHIHHATICNAFIVSSKAWGFPKPNALVEIFIQSYSDKSFISEKTI